MEALTLKEIAQAVAGELTGTDSVITDISTDTRKIRAGSLFIAIEGANFDGHDFVQKACALGARAVLVHKDVPCGCARIVADDTRLAQLRLAAFYRRKFQIPVVGITGSVGKTTTKEMVSAVLSEKYKTLRTEGNFNNDIGVPRMIFQLDTSYEAAVLEMGMSHEGEIAALTKAIQPTVAVISNIGVSHIENLGSQENILKAKLEILEGMAPDAPVILNGDDKFLKNAETGTHKVIQYGIDNKDCAYTAADIITENEKTVFTVTCPSCSVRIQLPAIGIHNVYNALAAIAAGETLGISAADCAKALSGYVPAGMRQRIRKAKGITFIEDCYNASPDSQKALLNALTDIEAGRYIAVLGDMLELGSISEQAHYDIGVYAAGKGIDMLCTYGAQAQSIAEGAAASGLKEIHTFQNKQQLASYLLSVLKEGDAVSFKASRGMKLEDVINLIYKGMGI